MFNELCSVEELGILYVSHVILVLTVTSLVWITHPFEQIVVNVLLLCDFDLSKMLLVSAFCICAKHTSAEQAGSVCRRSERNWFDESMHMSDLFFVMKWKALRGLRGSSHSSTTELSEQELTQKRSSVCTIPGKACSSEVICAVVGGRGDAEDARKWPGS